MSDTKIPWAEKSWNVVTGCSPELPCYARCYARKMALRLAGRFGYRKNEPFNPTFHEDKLGEVERWRKPCRVFVSSMGDIFNDFVPFTWRDRVFAVASCNPQHTYIVLTKRPENALSWTKHTDLGWRNGWPDNVWFGISAEDQAAYDERWNIATHVPATTLIASIEPMLGPVTLENGMAYPEWVICGPETGQGARPYDLAWNINLAEECAEHHIPYFDKQENPTRREYPYDN